MEVVDIVSDESPKDQNQVNDGTIESQENNESQVDSKSEVKTEPELPPQYRGKTLEELVKMHQDSQVMISKQAQEVGEVRKLADEIIKSQLKPSKQESIEEAKEVDLFENPNEAVKQLIGNDPRLQEATRFIEQAKAEKAKSEFIAKHPDGIDIVKDVQFQEWVKQSPIRVELFNRADKYDVNAADELLTSYKAIKAINKNVVENIEKEARDKSMKDASVESGGSTESSKKIYSRQKLLQMMMRDPSSYSRLADSGELALAYSEGRVKA